MCDAFGGSSRPRARPSALSRTSGASSARRAVIAGVVIPTLPKTTTSLIRPSGADVMTALSRLTTSRPPLRPSTRP